MRTLFLGDIVGRPGRRAVQARLKTIRSDLDIDLVLANGENASGGFGLSRKTARELLDSGVDVLTSGNHIWKFKDIPKAFDETERLLRPANYPEGAPGEGHCIYTLPGLPPFAVINLQGRTYMQAIDCPFASAERILENMDPEVKIVIVDFHAEATSEKTAMGWFLDGRVSAVLGTHTHIQTNDAKILPHGTAYLTDLGMSGPIHSCLGMNPEPIIERFITGRHVPFRVVNEEGVLQGAIFELDENTGKAQSIKVWQEPEPRMHVL